MHLIVSYIFISSTIIYILYCTLCIWFILCICICIVNIAHNLQLIFIASLYYFYSTNIVLAPLPKISERYPRVCVYVWQGGGNGWDLAYAPDTRKQRLDRSDSHPFVRNLRLSFLHSGCHLNKRRGESSHECRVESRGSTRHRTPPIRSNTDCSSLCFLFILFLFLLTYLYQRLESFNLSCYNCFFNSGTVHITIVFSILEQSILQLFF